MELSNIQKQIVMAKEPNVVVIAAAASGKTRMLTERVKYLLAEGADPKKIVVITFTNAAAEELGERIGNPAGLFIGTIHSYCNQLLLAHGHDTSKYIAEEDFDKLFEMIKQHPECIKEVDHLLLDEAQDSNPNQLEFIFDMVNPHNYMVVGDFRQSIYRFAGATPDFLIDLSRQKHVTTYDLNENYRNGSDILDYARSIITNAGWEYNDNSRPMRGAPGKVIKVDYSPTAIARTIKMYVEREGQYKDWFVIARTNAQVAEMQRALTTFGVPNDTFKRAQLDGKEFTKMMAKDSVKVLTIHTSKGLEAKNVVVIGVRYFNLEEKCIGYVAATRAKDLLVWATNHHFTNKKPRIERWD